MRLEDLARDAPVAREPDVPAWALGCFHRRGITYATGQEDATTRVIWTQSCGLTGDLRLPADRPDVSARGALSECSPAELVELAKGEGGVADTAFQDGLMSWSNWAAFQPYDKWPEPGELRRVGPALIEFAPSGIYVEDWRLQPGSEGLRVGLRLVSEASPGGSHRPRDGGLVIAGDHAIFALARRQSLAEGVPAWRQLAADPSLAETVFDCQACYVRCSVDGAWRIAFSIDPFAEGRTLALDGFEPVRPGVLRQTLDDGAERLWKIDVLMTGQPVPVATPAVPEGDAWLKNEAETLLPHDVILDLAPRIHEH
jgi:hypothetical protein